MTNGINLLKFDYEFDFPRLSRKEHYCCYLDKNTLENTNKDHSDKPAWARLEHKQCDNCTLSPSNNPYCPVALSLVSLSDITQGLTSFEETSTRVITTEREYLHRGDLQKGISPLVGLLMASSGCPVFEIFKPMARFHIPFASKEETYYRLFGTVLISNYYKNYVVNFDPGVLGDIYENVSVVNARLVQRFTDVTGGDSLLNSIVILDHLALRYVLDIEEVFSELKSYFMRD
ncbi:MAG: hypothetical protein HN353_04245 [Bdellovibrionales bacterium]|jgi:hypothetical protein|nr:hypothetical protein [Bdellovibrionales bacterium]MBT3526506.1 hypothetical protein [Bdellovibrionales bacterium]